MTPERRSITWKVVAIAMCSIVLPLIGVVYSSVDKRLSENESCLAHKIDRAEHDKDIQHIEKLVGLIRDDIKRHEENSRRRSR